MRHMLFVAGLITIPRYPCQLECLREEQSMGRRRDGSEGLECLQPNRSGSRRFRGSPGARYVLRRSGAVHHSVGRCAGRRATFLFVFRTDGPSYAALPERGIRGQESHRRLRRLCDRNRPPRGADTDGARAKRRRQQHARFLPRPIMARRRMPAATAKQPTAMKLYGRRPSRLTARSSAAAPNCFSRNLYNCSIWPTTRRRASILPPSKSTGFVNYTICLSSR